MMTYTEQAAPDVHDLPFDPATEDIVCEVRGEALHFNIAPKHVCHSPSGWEWGFCGSGPADFALNILARFLPAPGPCGAAPRLSRNATEAEYDAWRECQDVRLRLLDSTVVHRTAWRLHQPFCRAFVAKLPAEGGTIHGAEIRAWITEQEGRMR